MEHTDTERREQEQWERLDDFIASLSPSNPPFLQKIEKEALADGVPVIRPQTQSLLRWLLTLQKPARILEVGTAVGFSALLMRSCVPDAQIETIERDEARLAKARENYAAAGLRRGDGGAAALPELWYEVGEMPSRWSLAQWRGDAAEILERLDGPYDLIFMDAAKGQYVRFLPQAERLLRPGGVLLSDNILQDGEILESKFAVTRRNRTIHKRMREYLFALTHSETWQTVVLSTGDGAAVSIRK